MNSEIGQYPINQCCIIGKTKDLFGALSNMSAYPLMIGDLTVLTSEALYQAYKYPDFPDVQKKILAQKSPMSAKMVQKPYRHLMRDDWEEVKIEVMDWCLHLKFFQHKAFFMQLLRATQGKFIVEESRRDVFWGAKRENDYLLGLNILGKLWMHLRDQPPVTLTLPPIKNLKILNYE